MKIVKNRARCRVCNCVIESISKDDGIKHCTCGAIAVYGGKEAIMRLGHHRDIEDMSVKVLDSEYPLLAVDRQLHNQ